MRSARHTERRQEDRFPQSIDVLVQPLPEFDGGEPLAHLNIFGRTQNISHKGLCIITSEPVQSSSLIRCEIRVCNSDVRIATLMQVRWTRQRNKDSSDFISGLESLL